MLTQRMKKIVIALVAVLLLYNSVPFYASANETEQQEVQLTLIDKEELYVGDEFEISVVNKNNDDQTIIDIPEGVIYIGTPDNNSEGITYDGNRLIINSSESKVVRFTTNKSGNYSFSFSNDLGDARGTTEVSVHELFVEEPKEETIEETEVNEEGIAENEFSGENVDEEEVSLQPRHVSGTTYVFILNGGTGNFPNLYVPNGTTRALPTHIPVRPGYTFRYWAIGLCPGKDRPPNGSKPECPSGTKLQYLPGDHVGTYKVTDDDFSAVWSPNPYTVSYNSNGGTGSMANQTGTNGTAITLRLNTFTRPGYTFNGWSKTPNGARVYTNGQTVKDFGDSGTLYALWAPITSTITFNNNGGTGTMDPQTFSTGTTGSLTKNTFTRDHFKFMGWSTSPTGAKQYNDEQDLNTVVLNGNTTFYAVWLEDTYSVKFNPNGASGDAMANQTFRYFESKKLSKNTYTKTGYSFEGWSTVADGPVVHTDEKVVSKLADSGTLNLYAKWKANNYDIIFDSNGGSGTMANQPMVYDTAENLRKNTYTKTGYTFLGWSEVKDGPVVYTDEKSVSNLVLSGNKTLYAKWQVNNYKIKFDSNGGTGVMSDQDMVYDVEKNLFNNTFTRIGYTFLGWSKTKTGGVDYKNQALIKNLVESGVITLYAVWDANSYDIKFDANGGLGTMGNQSMKFGTEKALDANAYTKTGYTFMGWSEVKDGPAVYTDKTLVTDLVPSGTKTLYAKWEANKYTLKFHDNGATGTMGDQTVTYDTTVNINNNAFTKTDFRFLGWALTPIGEVAYTDGQSIKNIATSGEVNLYAVWERENYKINYHANEGDGASYSQDMKYGMPLPLLSNNFSKEGYRFVGWSNKPNNIVKYQENEVVDFGAEELPEYDLYAVWTTGEYEIIDGYVFEYNKQYAINLEDYPQELNDKVNEAYDKDHGGVRITNIETEQVEAPSFDFSNYKQNYGKHTYTFTFNTPNEQVVREIAVHISDNHLETNSYILLARNAYIGVEDAKKLLAQGSFGANVTGLMDAHAIDQNGNRVNVLYSSVSPSFAAVPGTYKVSFMLSGQTVSANLIVMDYDHVVQDGAYVIAANNFMIGRHDVEYGPQNLISRADAILFSVLDPSTLLNIEDQHNNLLHDGNAIQTVNFKGKDMSINVDVNAYLQDGTVIDGNKYLLVLDDSVTLQKFEAQDYIKKGVGTDNGIIGKFNAKSYLKSDLTQTSGTVIFRAYDFDDVTDGTATFGVVEDDNHADTTRVVNIKTDYEKPEVIIENSKKIVNIPVGGSFDYKDGVTAQDIDNPSNPINFELGNLVATDYTIDTNIRGVYPITYVATDKNGNTSDPAIKIIIVGDEIPKIDNYYIVANNVFDYVSSYGNDEASNKTKLLLDSKAYAIHDLTGERKAVEIVNLNGFTNKVGTYKIDVSVVDHPSTNTQSFLASLTDGSIIEGEKFWLTAKDATYGLKVAREIVEDTSAGNDVLLRVMNVRAIPKVGTSLVPNTDIQVDNNITEVKKQERDITFTHKHDSLATDTKTLTISKDEEGGVEDDIYLGANPFVIGRENIKEMNLQDYIDYSGANANKVGQTNPLTLEVTKGLNVNDGNLQVVTFKVSNSSRTVSVMAKVVEGKTVLGDDYVISGKDFSITGDQAQALMNTANGSPEDAYLLDNTNAYLNSYKRYTHQEAGDVVVYDKSTIKNEVNSDGYLTKFKVNDGTQDLDKPILDLKVTVNMGTAPELVVHPYTKIKLGETFNPEDGFKTGTALNDNIGINEMTFSDLDPNLITGVINNDVVGVYEVVYQYVDSYGVSAEAKHLVVVDDGSVVITDKHIIYGENVMLTVSEATHNVISNIKTKSKAYAYEINSGKRVADDQVIIKPGDVVAKEGRYTSYITVKDDSQEKSIIVVVTDGNVVEGDNHYVITAGDTIVGKRVAQEIIDDTSNELLIDLMRVEAIHKTKDEILTFEDIKVVDNITEAKQQIQDITFVVKADESALTSATLTVLDEEEVEHQDDIYLAANPFVIGRENLDSIVLKDYLDYSGAHAWNERTQDKITNIVVKEGLDKEHVSNNQKVTFAVTSEGKTVEVTVDVLIVDGRSVLGDDYVIAGQNFTITGNQAKELKDNLEDESKDVILLNHPNAKLVSYKKYSLEQAGTVVVEDRSLITNIKNEAGYDTTFRVKDDVHGVVEKPELALKVFVDMGSNPKLSVRKTSHLAIGDTFDAEAQFIEGSALNDGILDNEMVFSDLKSEWITGIDAVDSHSIGVYPVQYKYVDSYGLEVSVIHLVIVTDGSIVETDKHIIFGENVALKVEDVDSNVETTIKSKSKPYAYVIETGAKVSDSDIYIKKNNVVNEEGLYESHIYVEHDPIYKPIKVLVSDDVIEVGDDYSVTAYDTRITKAEAALDVADLHKLLVRKSRALAIHKTSLDDITVLVDSHLIESKIGDYDTRYYVEHEGSVDAQTVKNVEVVADKYVENEGSIFLLANSFIVSLDEVKAGIADADYADLAGAQAFNDKPNTYVYTPVLSGEGLTETVGTQYLDFVVKENNKVLDKPKVTVEVLVVDAEVKRDGDYTLVGKNMSISGADAYKLNQAKDDTHDSILLNEGQLKSYAKGTLEEQGTPYVVAETRNNVKAEVGTYDVKFGVLEAGVELSKPILDLDVSVSLVDKPELDIKSYSELEYLVDTSFDQEAQFKSGKDLNDDRELVFADLDVDDSRIDYNTVGIYTVDYSYTDISNQTTSKVHTVAVNDGSIVREDDYLIYGENVVLPLSQIKNLTDAQLEALVTPLVNARVVDINSGKDIDASRVSVSGFESVDRHIGVYPLVINIDGNPSQKVVELHITNGDIKPGDKYTLVTHDTTITVNEVEHEDVDALIINRSHTKAVSKTSSTLGTVVATHQIVGVVGTYPVEYHVQEEPTLKEEASVSVIDDTYIKEDQDVYVSGNDFVVGSNHVARMNEESDFAQYISLSEARAWSDDLSDALVIKVVESTKLKETPGVQFVTYYVEGYPKAQYTAQVRVTEGTSHKGDDYTITAKDTRVDAATAQVIIDGEDNESNLIVEEDLAHVQVFKNRSIEKEDVALTLDTSLLKATKGEYDVSFSLASDSETSISTKVDVSQGNLPTLQINEVQEVLIDSPETYDELFGYRLDDNNGGGILDPIVVYDEDEFTDVGGKLWIDKSDLDLSKLGIYIVNYKAKDNNFNIVEGYQVVVVTDGEIPDVEEHYIYAENVVLDYDTEVKGQSDDQIMASIASKTNGYALNYKDLTRTGVTVTELPSDFIYDESVNTVAVHAIGNEDVKTTILVTITRGDIEYGTNYNLVSNNAYMLVKELKSLSELQIKNVVIDRANALAIPVHGTVMGHVDFDEKVEAKAMNVDVNYYVVEEPAVTNTNAVYVMDKDVIEEVHDHVIVANDFAIGILDIEETRDSEFVALANAEVINKKDNSKTKPNLVDKPKEEIGEWPVFFESDKETDLKIEVVAKVYAGHVVSDDDYYINALPVFIEVARADEIAKELSEGDETGIRELTKVQSYKRKGRLEVASIFVDENPPIEGREDTYYLTFAVEDAPTVKIKVPVVVDAGKLPTLTVPKVIDIKQGTLEDDVDLKFDTRAVDNNTNLEIPKEKISVSGHVDYDVIGVYPIEYTVTDSNKNTVTEKSTVVINDGSYEVVEDYLYRAKNFIVHIDDVNSQSGIEAQILDLSEASAYNLVEHEAVDPRDLMLVDAKGFKKEVATYPGIVLGIRNTHVTRSVDGEVADRKYEIGDLYMISAVPKVIGQIDAAAVTEDNITTLMDVVVKERVPNLEQGIPQVDNFEEFSTQAQKYPMTFSVKQESKTRTTETLRVMDRDDVVTEGNYIIAANRFYVGLDDLNKMGDTKSQRMIDLAQAYAIRVEGNNDVSVSVRWDEGPTHEVSVDNPVTFSILGFPNINVVTYATVLKGNVVQTDEYYITSQSATAPISDLPAIKDGSIDIFELMKVGVFKRKSNEKVSGEQIETDLTTLKAQESDNDITFFFMDENNIKQSITSVLSLRKGEAPKLKVDKVQNIDVNTADVYDDELGLEYSDKEDDANGVPLNVIKSGNDTVQKAFEDKEIGVYTVSYELTDSDLNTAYAYQTVVINDGSIVVTDEYALEAKSFYINHKDVINTEVELLKRTEAKAYKLGVDHELVDVKAVAPTYSQSIGKHDVNVFVEDHQDTKTTVQAHVVNDDVQEGSEYTILASKGFVGLKQAEGISDQELIDLTNARAYYQRLDEEVDVELVSHNVEARVGVYSVSFKVVEEPNTTITVDVEVLDSKYVLTDQDYVIAADDFVVGMDDIDFGISNEQYVTYARAYAFSRYDLTETFDVEMIDDTAPTVLGNNDVSFRIKEHHDTEINVIATVLKGNVVLEDKYYINAQDETIFVSKALEVLENKDILKDISMAKAGDIYGNDFDVVVVDHNVLAKHGAYEVTFAIKEHPSVKITVDVNVDQGEAPVLNVPEYTEVALGSTFDEMANVSAIDDRDGDITQNIVVNRSAVDTSTLGVYVVEYDIVDSDLNISTAKSYVIVNDGSIVIEDGYIIQAENFMINRDNVVGDNEEILRMTKAKAYHIESYTEVDVHVKDEGGYTNIASDYTITLAVSDKPSVEKYVRAIVVKDDVIEGDDYLLSANDITIGLEDARSITDPEIIGRAHAIALHKTLGTDGTVVITENRLEGQEGLYPVTYAVVQDPLVTVGKTIKVLPADLVVEEDQYVIYANNFQIGDQYIKEMTKDDLVDLAQAGAYLKADVNTPLTVTQREDIIVAIGDHNVTFEIVGHEDNAVVVNKTVFKDTMYYIEADDATIMIGDLSKSIASNNLESKIIDITHAQGYRINGDGSRESMPVYVSNKDLLLSAKANSTYDLGLTLVDPNNRTAPSNRVLSESHRIEESDTQVTVLVKEDPKEESQTPKTGLASVNSLMYVLLLIVSMLVLLVTMKFKRKRV